MERLEDRTSGLDLSLWIGPPGQTFASSISYGDDRDVRAFRLSYVYLKSTKRRQRGNN